LICSEKRVFLSACKNLAGSVETLGKKRLRGHPIFSGFIKQKDKNRPYCKVNLSLTDLKIVFQRARQVLFGLKAHTSVRRQITWRDYLTYLEMIHFLIDLLAGASRNCFWVQEIGLFSVFNTDFLAFIQCPPPNIYKRWLIFEFYHGLLKGDYPRLESCLAKCSHWVSPPLLSTVMMALLLCIFYLFFNNPKYFLSGILICTVGRLLDIQLSVLIAHSHNLLYSCYCQFESFLAVCSDWMSEVFIIINSFVFSPFVRATPISSEIIEEDSYWISPPVLSKVIIILFFGSLFLCFSYAGYFLCEILISTVFRMVLLPSCLIAATFSFGSPFLFFCYAACRILCEILIFTVCEMIVLLPYCLIPAILFLLYNLIHNLVPFY